jgi:hypothetical protein
MRNPIFWDINLSSYFTGNTLLLRYRAQPVNAMLRFEVFKAVDYDECRLLGCDAV